MAPLAFWLASLAPGHGHAQLPGPAALKSKYGEIRSRLEKSAFGRPMAIDSTQKGGELAGEVHALIAQPYPKVRAALARASGWCELLTLPFNMQKCEARGDSLRLYIGRKPDSPLEDATRLDFTYSLAQDGEDALQVLLTTPSGPAGTRDYRIAFAAIPLEGGRTFVHLSYGYAHSAMSSMAMKVYLSTSGAGKVGFSTEGEAGGVRLVEGMRAVIERNAMRYFLAIEAYLDTLDVPPERRHRARLERWFDATERYPRQLREMTKERYLAIKQKTGGAPEA